MNTTLKLLLLAEGFSLLAAGLLGPIYAIFVEEIGGDILEASGAYVGFSLAAGIMIILISRWEDHVKHKEKLVIIGYAIGACAILGYMFVTNSFELIIVQIALGIASAIGTPAFDGLYSMHLDRGKFSSEWGLYDSMYYIVTALSAGAGGIVASFFGFHTLFTVMFLISLISIAVSVRLFYINR